ncbi:MAG TPA: hypothetical protein EYP56_18410 [Planctomycetaceae bacterium]|nr:hypothetical protein [Planctomycetaceae bacterium]
MRIIHTVCAAYWALLTVLLLVPDPAALVGLDWPGRAGGGRGVHFVLFLALGGLLVLGRWPVRAGWLVAAAALYGLATEALQWLVPQRSVELLDAAENLLGLLAGTLIALGALRLGGRSQSLTRRP